MSDSYDLFAWARNSDPDTAHAAADALSGSEALARLQKRVCTTLAAHPEGLTTTEIARLVGLPRDSISPRMKTLAEGQFVEDSGERRVPVGKTRSSIVWRLSS
jgi:Helix-turn-helix domain